MDEYVTDPNYLVVKETLRRQKRKYLIGTLILLPINIFLFSFFIEDGTSVYQRFIVSTQAFLISFTGLGFFVGLIVALFPYKELSYGRKYLRSSLLSIYVMSITIFVVEAFASFLPMLMNSDNQTHADSLKSLEIVRQEIEVKEDSIMAVYERLILLKKASKLSDQQYESLKKKAFYFRNQINDQLNQVTRDFQGKISPEEYESFGEKIKLKAKPLQERKKELEELGIDFKFK